MIKFEYLKLTNLPVFSVLLELNKDRLIIEQWEEIKKLRSEINVLKKLQKKVKKTSKNSGVPLSKDFKTNKESYSLKRALNHSDGGSELCLTHSDIKNFKELKCSECNNSELKHNLVSSYDKVFLPEVK